MHSIFGRHILFMLFSIYKKTKLVNLLPNKLFISPNKWGGKLQQFERGRLGNRVTCKHHLKLVSPCSPCHQQRLLRKNEDASLETNKPHPRKPGKNFWFHFNVAGWQVWRRLCTVCMSLHPGVLLTRKLYGSSQKSRHIHRYTDIHIQWQKLSKNLRRPRAQPRCA